MVSSRASLKERFWDKVSKTDTCWNWTGGVCKKTKTPMIANKNKVYVAYRISWEMHYGAIPKGLMVCHRCDNRICIRPDHLFLGTHQDNMTDMRNKWRQNFGERNGQNKLKPEEVVEIVARYKGGDKSGDIAKEFGIHPMYVCALARGITWKHLGLAK